MAQLNADGQVKEQYADGKNLSTRAGLHAKYSTNPMGLTNWLFNQYRFEPGGRILELGCGTGSQWEGWLEELPEGCSLILSDFSPGMVETVRAVYGGMPGVKAELIDIQQIPYPDGSFDTAIANFMLYHVPDLPRAIGEVRRVLKPGGRFYAATNGNGGLMGFMREAMERCGLDPSVFARGFSFSLQNGGGLLEPYFAAVERRDYPDALAVTGTADLVDWVRSTGGMTGYTEGELDKLSAYFEGLRRRDGVIYIPKECGMFVCRA